MTYFTDMLLIPSDDNCSHGGLRQALNGTRMMRLAQAAGDPHMVFDFKRAYEELESGGERAYYEEFSKALNGLMEKKDREVYYETSGAWGGPGGWSEYGSHGAFEPEVSHPVDVADSSSVIIQLTNTDVDWEHYRDEPGKAGYNSVLELAEDMVKDMGPTDEETSWEVEKLPENDRLGVFWVPSEG